VVGTQFEVKSDALGVGDSTKYASLWSWSGESTAGPATLEITGASGSQTCKVSLRKVSGSCTTASTFRSPETGHTHMRVGSTSIAKGAFPASGNHWGAWAPWNTVYEKPIKRGFLLHNLEHGGIVLSYGCSSADDSADCKEAAANLAALKESFGEQRVIVTPDPEQSTMYGVRAWRTGFSSDCFDDQRMLDFMNEHFRHGLSSDCFDDQRMLDFMNEHFRHGREDVDADPPIKFDPTTTQVPCVDIMAAPDSCS
jgi:hypothetical protein